MSRGISRRSFAAGAAALAASAQPVLAQSRSWRSIPRKPSARVIVDNDFAGDPDGLLALAHQMLSPKSRVELITSSALNPEFSKQQFPGGGTARAGALLASELLRRGKFPRPPLVVGGSEDFGATNSLAAPSIVAEALRDDPMPLFLTCGGPLTNVAAALQLEPRIAGRMTVVWIGGGGYPNGGWEYNLATDQAAARHVIEESRVPLWQVPQAAYRQMQYSIAELEADLRPISPFARWIYDRFTAPPDFVQLGQTWPLGDSPLVMATAISNESSRFTDQPARRIKPDLTYGTEIADRKVRVYEQLDSRLTFADFLALLRLHGGK